MQYRSPDKKTKFKLSFLLPCKRETTSHLFMRAQAQCLLPGHTDERRGYLYQVQGGARPKAILHFLLARYLATRAILYYGTTAATADHLSISNL